MTRTPQRNAYWDTVKALLIFLVVTGHCIQHFTQGDFWTNPVFTGIYIFHMPLFMFISGYFCHKSLEKRGWHTLPRYSMRLVPAILAFTAIRAAILLRHMPLAQISPAYLGVLWFFTVLLECCLFGCIMTSLKHRAWRTAWCVLPLVIGIAADGYLPYARFFTTMWPCFLLGTQTDTLRRLAARCERWHWLSLPAAAAALYLFRTDWYMYITPLTFSTEAVLAWIYRLLCAGAVSAAFLYIMDICQAGQFTAAAVVGRHTLGMYVLQAAFFKLLPLLPLSIPLLGTATSCLLSACVFLALYGTYIITRRIPIIPQVLYGESLDRRKHTC